MIIVKTFGGLGNQMFQYAFGKGICDKVDGELYLDISHHQKFSISRLNKFFDKHYKHRKFALGIFNLDYKIAKQKHLWQFKVFNFEVKKKLFKIFHKDISKIGRNTIKRRNKTFHFFEEQKKFRFDEEVMEILNVNNSNIFFYGYWQNPRYFNHIKTQLIQDFNLVSFIPEQYREYEESIKKSNSVAIHIRRDDYLSYGRDTSLDYYRKAVKLIQNQIKSPKFYLFSDNIEWCLENVDFQIQPQNITFIRPKQTTAIHDMALMNQCKHLIIANSTFSWWAAWLSEENKIIIAPKKWTQTYTNFENGIIPSYWIQL